jgi:hypothetical protein
MGILIRIGGLRLGSSRGASVPAYWKNQSNFYELWTVTGSGSFVGLKRGDILTVTGTGLNAIYAVPDTDAYKTRDIDYGFHKSDGSVSTLCDGNRLIAYDFSKIIVKYLDVSPYTIEYIGILDTGQSVNNKMRDDFHLSIWWDNVLSDHGATKQNRGIGQSVWTAESVGPTYVLHDTFTDTNGVHLHDHTMNVGAGWTAGTDFVISGNKLVNTGTGGVVLRSIAESGKADVDVSAVINMGTSLMYTVMLYLRYVDSSHWWELLLERDGAAPYVKLFYNDGAGRIGVGLEVPVTQHDNTEYTLRITAKGNVINCYWSDPAYPGVLRTTTDALFNTATKVGIGAYADASYVFLTTDDFIVLDS